MLTRACYSAWFLKALPRSFYSVYLWSGEPKTTHSISKLWSYRRAPSSILTLTGIFSSDFQGLKAYKNDLGHSLKAMNTHRDRSLQLPERAELCGGEESEPCVNPYESSTHQTSEANTMSQLGCEDKGRQRRECRHRRRDQQMVVCCPAFMQSQDWCFYQLCKCKYSEASRIITVLDTPESQLICKHCLPLQRYCPMRSQLSQSQGSGCYAVRAKSWSQWSREKLCQREHTLSFSPHLWLPSCWKHSEFAYDSNGKERTEFPRSFSSSIVSWESCNMQ